MSQNISFNLDMLESYLSHGRPNFQLSWNFLIHVLGVFASGVTLVDAPLLLDEGFGLEEVSLTTLLELAELKPNADNLLNLDCDGDEKSSLRLPIITT
jgi:hypothetical protein